MLSNLLSLTEIDKDAFLKLANKYFFNTTVMDRVNRDRVLKTVFK